MSARSQITKDLNDSVRTVLGPQTKILVKYMVKYEIKSEKYENKVLVFTSARIFILSAKVPTKIDCHVHYLDISGIESKKSSSFSISTNDKNYSFATFEDSGTFNSNADVILTDLSSAIKQIFPTIPLKYIIKRIEISPPDRVPIFSDEFRTDPRNIGPCGGFSLQYACLCDQLGIPYKEEIAWDIDTIYYSHDYKTLDLRDFDHMEQKDYVALIAVLEFNTHFRGLKIKSMKLSNEVFDKILHVLRRSMWLEEIHLESLGMRYDYINKLSNAIISNSNTAIRSINLNHNYFEDKGVIHLASSVAKISKGFTELNLSHCGFAAKGTAQLFHFMLLNQNNLNSLTKIDLSGNNLKDDINNLSNFLAQPNVIEYLDISKTDTNLENLFGALLRGCSTNLSYLNVSHNFFGTKKGKEIPPSFKQFFTSTLSLKHLNISNCKLPIEALKHLLLGLACNESTCSMSLNISCNSLGQQGAHVLESCIHGVRVLSSLDISENCLDYELSSILHSIGKNPSIRYLNIAKSFVGTKLKNIPIVMDSLVTVIQRDEFLLRELDISDNKLKYDLHNFISALSNNQTIEVLDISGNIMGDIGARLLAKALQINNKLKSITIDRNNITIQGYSDIVQAMGNNYSVINIPFPLNDITPCHKNQPEKTDHVMKLLQEYLYRNNNIGIKKIKTGIRLQHSFLLSSTNQLIDKLIFEIQENNSTQNEEASESAVQQLLEDAENCKKLLPLLQGLVRVEKHPVEMKFNRVKSELQDAIKLHLEMTMREMLRVGMEKCPKIFNKQNVIHDLKKSCEEKLTMLDDNFLQQLIVNGFGSEIMNKIGEIEESMAIMISEKATDEILETLTLYQQGKSDVLETLDCKVDKDMTRSKSNEGGFHINTSFSQKLQIAYSEDDFKLEYLNLATPHHLSKKRLMTKKIRPQSFVTLGLENLNVKHPSDYLCSPTMSCKSRNDSTMEEDSITELPSQSTLQHLVKNRPKRAKTRAPTKALVTDIDNEIDEGMETFFKSATPTTLTPLISPTTDSCSSLSFADRFSDIASDSTPLMDERKQMKPELMLKNINSLNKSLSNENFDELDKSSPIPKLKKAEIVDKSKSQSGVRTKDENIESECQKIICDNQNEIEIAAGGSIVGISIGKCLQDP